MKPKKKKSRKITGPEFITDRSADIIDGSSLKPTLLNVAKVYNVTVSRIQSLLKQRGHIDISNPGRLLNRQQLYIVDQAFAEHKVEAAKSRGTYRVNWLEAAYIRAENRMEPPVNQVEIPEKETFPILNSVGNQFGIVKLEVAFKDKKVIRSHFTDMEAANICSKMVSSMARSTARKFIQSRESNDMNRYIMHYIASKALNLYGGHLLSFIYRLRNLEFKNSTAESVRNYKDVSTEFPSLTFMSGNDQLTISFYKKRLKDRMVTKPWISRKREFIGTLDKQGMVEVDATLHALDRFRPLFELFVEKLKSGQYKITSGVETGICGICGRELTDPVSLRYGVGPVCRELMH